MKLFSRLIFYFFSNALALLAAVYFVDGFKIESVYIDFLMAAAVFTLLNVFIKPIFKLIFGPIIIITLGLGIILVNAFILYLLDFFSDGVNIEGLTALFYATLIIGLVNIIINFFAKGLYFKKQSS